MIQTGLDVLLASSRGDLANRKIGLLTNQASVNSELVHNRLLLHQKYGGLLTTLYAPQHGFYSEKQDNMVESADCTDEVTGLPVYSLYGDVRKPTEEMVDNIDILLIDLQDVGTRVYTFIYTAAYCLEAAAEHGKKIIVLDRPNPIGGIEIEGNILEKECSSFVGLYPIPMRHGLTLGEFLLMINEEFSIGAELEVVPMIGWERSMLYTDTGLPWVYPSPNMPTIDTALVYPGQVIWEGTNCSEGRGTTRPFELIGAPYFTTDEILEYIRGADLPGCFLRPILFQPTSGKWAGDVCKGFQLHVTDHKEFLPYRTSLTLLKAIIKLYPKEFEYKAPPYEYEYERLPMDLILGSTGIRMSLERDKPVAGLETEWQQDLLEFETIRKRYLIYQA